MRGDLSVPMLSADPLLPAFSPTPFRGPARRFIQARLAFRAFIFIQLIHFCSTITLLCSHLCSTPAGFSLLRAPAASVRPVPVSEGVATTKELGGCHGVGGMNGR